jgi:hypothetical protein
MVELFAISVFILYSFIFYPNLFIYYESNAKAYPWFPILNPLSFASYELMLLSMFTFRWRLEGKNLRLKKFVNFCSKLLVVLILINIITVMVMLAQ